MSHAEFVGRRVGESFSPQVGTVGRRGWRLRTSKDLFAEKLLVMSAKQTLQQEPRLLKIREAFPASKMFFAQPPNGTCNNIACMHFVRQKHVICQTQNVRKIDV